MKRVHCLLTCLFLVLSLSVSAFAEETTESTETEYTYNKIVWNLANSSEAYGGQLGGVVQPNASGVISGSALSVPLSVVDYNRLYLGAQYPKLLNDFQNQAIYKMVITITMGATGDYTGSGPQLFNSTLSGNCIAKTGRQNLSIKPTITTGSNTSYTFTWDNIEYDKIVDYPLIYADFSLSDFESSMSSEIYIAGMYFGLSSYYDDDQYKAEVMENMKNIDDKLQQQIDQEEEHHQEEMEQDAEQHEETKGLLGSIIDGITGIPGKIKEAFNSLIDEIKENVVGNITSAMDGFLEDLKDKLGILYQAPDYFVRIIESILITDKSNEMIFPSMVIPVGSDEYTLNQPTPFQIFPDWIPEGVYTFINLAMSITVILAVINYADKKWEEITTNG